MFIINDCSVFPCYRFQATIRKSFPCFSKFFNLVSLRNKLRLIRWSLLWLNNYVQSLRTYEQSSRNGIERKMIEECGKFTWVMSWSAAECGTKDSQFQTASVITCRYCKDKHSKVNAFLKLLNTLPSEKTIKHVAKQKKVEHFYRKFAEQHFPLNFPEINRTWLFISHAR